MDPFSVTTGVVGLLDVTIRIIQYLRDVKEAVKTIEGEIQDLIDEVEALRSTCEQLEILVSTHETVPKDGEAVQKLWENVRKRLERMNVFGTKLESCVKEVYGKDPRVSGNIDGLMKQHRKRDRNQKLAEVREQIAAQQRTLQFLLGRITQSSVEAGFGQTTTRLEAGREQTATLLVQMQSLESEVRKQNELHEEAIKNSGSAAHLPSYSGLNQASLEAQNSINLSIDALAEVLRERRRNKYFETPRVLATNYTGREAECRKLASWLIEPSGSKDSNQHQKRFVISGFAGSGKTQFCCKFAEDFRESFWGVFSINGESRESLEHDLMRKVAPLGENQPNYRAALRWLSNQEEPWLLIIDNVDDPNLDLEEYLPHENRGHILITTRTIVHRGLGNVGDQFFFFQGLRKDEASSLLLEEAAVSKPWGSSILQKASEITAALGWLAIAIARAGAAIRQGHCRMEEYLEYYEVELRRARSRQRSSSRKGRHSDASQDRRNATVQATFEVNYSALMAKPSEKTRDAAQLLRLFGFFHSEDIRLEFLKRAVENHKLEREQVKKEETVALTWSESASSISFLLRSKTGQFRSFYLLPDIMRDGLQQGKFDIFRAREAMTQLTEYSFVSYDQDAETYSFHALAHKWAREMQDADISQQAAGLEAAAVILADAILLPDLASKKDEILRRDLYPHVDHVVRLQDEIKAGLQDAWTARMRLWPLYQEPIDGAHLEMATKFSFVFVHNARWSDAVKLLTVVRRQLHELLGYKLESTRQVAIFLSYTLCNLGHFNTAEKLLLELQRDCLHLMGPEHHQTMLANLNLGWCFYRQGRISEAKNLLDTAFRGLRHLYGLEHKETAQAMDLLGVTLRMLYTKPALFRARQLQRMAMRSSEASFGKNSLEALQSKETFCMTAIIMRREQDLREALVMIQEVITTRQTSYGREHAETLSSQLVKALIYCEMNRFDDAERLLDWGLPIAKASIGPDHFGYLLGRASLGRVYVGQMRYQEAVKVLTAVAEDQGRVREGLGKDHPIELRP